MKSLLIFKKEFKTFFSSPLAYVLSALFILVTGYIFFNLLVNYVETIQNLPAQNGKPSFNEAVTIKLFANMNFILLFITPLITMRLVAEEKKQRSIQLLFSAPLKESEIILGKFISSFSVVLFMMALTLIFPIILYSTGMFDGGYILSGYIGVLLNVLCYLSIGIFASTLTENQIIAALLTFVFIMFSWIIAWLSQNTSQFILVEIFNYLSIVYHFENMLKGLIETKDLVYYFSFVFLFLFMSQKSLEQRNW